ncbi:class I adenylate-forming enzyme family protein [Dactylosporangium sp. NPDC051484]|uniref:class I adenylate-forming enzyme family protein n=1 Tax=Dactylosporangium sp. NPDC051484 TaxID=3154942 RepID=UPI00344F8A14
MRKPKWRADRDRYRRGSATLARVTVTRQQASPHEASQEASAQSQPTWGESVARELVRGHPTLVYANRPKCITAVLDESRRWAGRPFIIQGERTITFAEHERMVATIATRLRSEGVRPGDTVAIFASNSPEWVATFFAVMALGAIVVPCNGWWSAEEMEHAVLAVTPRLVVCDERRGQRVQPNVRQLNLATLAADATAAAENADDLMMDVGEDSPAAILFTAGTTEFPKGVTLSHRALVANLQTLLTVSRKLPHLISDDIAPSVTLVGLPLFHIGAIQLILVPMITGSQIVFLEGRFDPDAVLRLMEGRGVTMFSGVPTMMQRLLAHPDVDRRDLSTVRTVVLGGSPVDTALLEKVARAFPNTRRGVGQTYGLTEAGGVVSTGVGTQIRSHPGSSGKVAPVVEIQIDQPDDNGDGEILVRSPACMNGYWGLVDDEVINESGWLRTGDIGHLDDDNYLYVTGRSKDVIIRGGENVAASRVESVLQSHPAVAEAAVVGLPDEEYGQIVGAAIRLRTQDLCGQAELSAYAAQRLAQFAVPTQWWFFDSPLPTNDSGKVLKSQIVSNWPAQNKL